MSRYLRALIVGRDQSNTNRVTGILEGNGWIVTNTLSDSTALDLAGSSNFDAVVIARDVSAADRGYLRTEIVRKRPSTVVVVAQAPESVVTQLKQAFKEMGMPIPS